MQLRLIDREENQPCREKWVKWVCVWSEPGLISGLSQAQWSPTSSNIVVVSVSLLIVVFHHSLLQKRGQGVGCEVTDQGENRWGAEEGLE